MDSCSRAELTVVSSTDTHTTRKEHRIKTYLVATHARYVLVQAADEATARDLGHTSLYDLYADLRARLGREVPVQIHTVRLAADDEILLWKFHTACMAS